MTAPPTPTPPTATKPAAKKIPNDLVANNPFVEFVKLYKNNPVLFVKEVLNTNPDPWQIEFLNHIAAGNRRISVRSGHGVGKSTASAWAMIWYLFLRFPVKVVVTAPTSSQLYDALFAELKRWVKALPGILRTCSCRNLLSCGALPSGKRPPVSRLSKVNRPDWPSSFLANCQPWFFLSPSNSNTNRRRFRRQNRRPCWTQRCSCPIRPRSSSVRPRRRRIARQIRTPC